VCGKKKVRGGPAQRPRAEGVSPTKGKNCRCTPFFEKVGKTHSPFARWFNPTQNIAVYPKRKFFAQPRFGWKMSPGVSKKGGVINPKRPFFGKPLPVGRELKRQLKGGKTNPKPINPRG